MYLRRGITRGAVTDLFFYDDGARNEARAAYCDFDNGKPVEDFGDVFPPFADRNRILGSENLFQSENPGFFCRFQTVKVEMFQFKPSLIFVVYGEGRARNLVLYAETAGYTLGQDGFPRSEVARKQKDFSARELSGDFFPLNLRLLFG